MTGADARAETRTETRTGTGSETRAEAGTEPRRGPGTDPRAEPAVDPAEDDLDVVEDEAAAQEGPLVPMRRPILRGWLHLASGPVALVLGLVLMAMCDSEPLRWALAVYIVTTVLLFGVSAIYHVITWPPRTRAILRRIDHANIFVFIAGSYTPLAVALLEPPQERNLLILVWLFAALGVGFKVLWLTAPRWLSVLSYVGMGWVAVIYAVPIWQEGGPAVALLLILGGVLYTLGAVAYAARRPDPFPTWFGYHEVFHSFTIVAYLVHYVAIAMAVT